MWRCVVRAGEEHWGPLTLNLTLNLTLHLTLNLILNLTLNLTLSLALGTVQSAERRRRRRRRIMTWCWPKALQNEFATVSKGHSQGGGPI